MAGEVDDKTEQARQILLEAKASADAKKNEVDPRVTMAQNILSQAVARNSGQGASASGAAQEMPPALPEVVDETYNKLPQAHKQMLRQCYQDPMTGQWQAYFLGTLKSYSSAKGFGFVACAAASAHWGCDVFIHKSQVPVPWNINQTCEFAVVMNQQGKPQATDCFWLPQLPKARAPFPKQMGAGYTGGLVGAPGPGPGQASMFSPHGPSSAAPYPPNAPPAGQANASGGDDSGGGPVRNFAEGPFYLGTLKSYSAAKGYGFLQCEEVKNQYQRDIYFDKTQLPRPEKWTTGQTLEFQVGQNARGQPIGRNIFWDCIPLLPPDSGKEPPAQSQTKHSPQSLDKLRMLLRLLNDSEKKEEAVVTAIDYQGVEKSPTEQLQSESNMLDVDYVTFVLDRLGTEGEAVGEMKDFVKMLLLLMLAKMLKKQFHADRLQKLTRWLVLLSAAIDPSTEKEVQGHFLDVVGQIEGSLQGALRENANIRQPAVSATIHGVLQELKSKARSPN